MGGHHGSGRYGHDRRNALLHLRLMHSLSPASVRLDVNEQTITKNVGVLRGIFLLLLSGPRTLKFDSLHMYLSTYLSSLGCSMLWCMLPSIHTSKLHVGSDFVTCGSCRIRSIVGRDLRSEESISAKPHRRLLAYLRVPPRTSLPKPASWVLLLCSHKLGNLGGPFRSLSHDHDSHDHGSHGHYHHSM